MPRSILVLILVLLLGVSAASAQTATPDGPPLFPVPDEDIAEGLGAADATLATIPDLPTPPDLDDAQVLFGYAKWLLYGNLAGQVAGLFGPIINHIGFYVTMNIVMSAIYTAVYVVAVIIKALIWFGMKVLRLIDIVAQIVQAVGGGLLGALGKLLKG